MESREEWRPVVGYESRYMVSNEGRVLSLLFNTFKSLRLDRHGYPAVNITENGKRWKKSVHRLVADAFCEKRGDDANQVNHLDGVKTNNHASNLEWVTGKENTAHSIRTGLTTKITRPKLTENDVVAIRLSGESTGVIAKEYGVGTSCIREVKRRSTWKHVA